VEDSLFLGNGDDLVSFMAVLVLAVVLITITGANYFGLHLKEPVWLVLFILSVAALLLALPRGWMPLLFFQ
jgi:hypothetical protein